MAMNSDYRRAGNQVPQHRVHACLWLVDETQGRCNVVCQDERTLRGHVEEAHIAPARQPSDGSRPDNIRCRWGDCDRSPALSRIGRHMDAHTDSRDFPCGYAGCDKTFRTADHRSKHENTHASVRKYQCTFPGCTHKGFNTKDGQRSHETRHDPSKARSYACDRGNTGDKASVWGCVYTNTDSSNLRKHRLRCHLGPDAVTCPSCHRYRDAVWEGGRGQAAQGMWPHMQKHHGAAETDKDVLMKEFEGLKSSAADGQGQQVGASCSVAAPAPGQQQAPQAPRRHPRDAPVANPQLQPTGYLEPFMWQWQLDVRAIAMALLQQEQYQQPEEQVAGPAGMAVFEPLRPGPYPAQSPGEMDFATPPAGGAAFPGGLGEEGFSYARPEAPLPLVVDPALLQMQAPDAAGAGERPPSTPRLEPTRFQGDDEDLASFLPGGEYSLGESNFPPGG